jgi:hypothetical protein
MGAGEERGAPCAEEEEAESNPALLLLEVNRLVLELRERLLALAL